tara:strand:+ start:178 stop:849 length:672 start_codon:yes stop_codon:yes gene_type:complete
MSRVIKNNDGVAIVEGTPAASLVKDVDRFFASKPPERMAGQSIYQPRKIDPNNRNLKSITKKAPEADNTMFIGGSKDFNEKTGRVESKPQSERTDEERRANLEAFDRLSEERKRERTINTRPRPEDGGFGGTINKRLRSSTRKPRPRPEDGGFGGTINRRREQMDDTPKRSVEEPDLRRSEAKEKAEFRRKRFFERRRSAKEAKRSEREQEATQGKFITTLGR